MRSTAQTGMVDGLEEFEVWRLYEQLRAGRNTPFSTDIFPTPPKPTLFPRDTQPLRLSKGAKHPSDLKDTKSGLFPFQRESSVPPDLKDTKSGLFPFQRESSVAQDSRDAGPRLFSRETKGPLISKDTKPLGFSGFGAGVDQVSVFGYRLATLTTKGRLTYFMRRIFVEAGLIQRDASTARLGVNMGLWVASSLNPLVFGAVTCGPFFLESVFERGSGLEKIEDKSFYQSQMRSIVIPSSIVVLGRLSFCMCRSLESVTFEAGSRLERIEEAAFAATALGYVVIPASVAVLGADSFSKCASLELVVFENGSRLERIEACAFYGAGLKAIEIPANVTFIGVSAFGEVHLDEISISPDNTTFRLREWALERLNGSVIFQYCGCCRSVVIPSSVRVLWQWSFSDCEKLESVVFEAVSQLERIEESAFSRCGLKGITIPASVSFLGPSSFANCKSLGSMAFENGSQLDRIEEWAFRSSGLRSFVIPPRVSFIASSAFAEVLIDYISISGDNRTFRLREGFLEDYSGTTIYRYFGACRSVVIPSSVVLVKAGFLESKWPEFVDFEERSRLEKIESKAFSRSGLKSIVIPSSVLVLEESCFAHCHCLTQVTFENGSGLRRIEEYAFYGCRVAEIVIPFSVGVLGKSCLGECPLLAAIVFEEGSRLERVGESAFDWRDWKPAGLLSLMTELDEEVSLVRDAFFGPSIYLECCRSGRVERFTCSAVPFRDLLLPDNSNSTGGWPTWVPNPRHSTRPLSSARVPDDR
jgi:hypothetical protein